ncbi:hypothetical protein CEUSTIGMA_g466.t1 [Chlamydomonas eustigma]|uniref:Major facilitator superfamily (MFS) profile domain-containing protein n=1 Tax=Chlamydomonas eustigma TaxID=1157962 RepID=A0A250WQ88_9CHLO|nr:hypothetical protein CEUSTIGMA_g466.t1 [Chlamydomonas eustigma]|eukprot:GAX73014.1 hypothetical protein CEUSTIGMA_g466.t1 [Chlamydomonas eustigma]
MSSRECDDQRVPLLGNASKSRKEKHPPQKNSTLLTVCPYILGNELCERLAYNGIASNLVTYITEVIGGNPGLAAILVAVFEGACYTTPIIGAVFADSYWGRYKTIFVFSVIYLVGVMMLALSSWPPLGAIPKPDEDPGWFAYTMLFGSLGIIALGTGGIKPNVSSFGADQFNDADAQDRREKESFFNYFYLAVNVGSLIACTVIVYIQDSYSWTLGFAIPGAAMLLAIMFFVSGSSVYVHVLPTESPMVRVYKVVRAAMFNRWKKKHSSDLGVCQTDDGDSMHGSQLFGANAINRQKQLPVVGRSSSMPLPKAAPITRMSNPHSETLLQVPLTTSSSHKWLEDAITDWETSQGQHIHVGGLAGYTPKQVEEVKMVLRLLPVFAATVMYWTIYTQMSSMFVAQGSVMQRDFVLAGTSVHVPSASMAVFNTVAVILLIWLYDSYAEPFLRRCGYQMTLLRRMGWGMVVAAMAMGAAAVLEAWRLHVYRQEYCAPCDDDGQLCCRPGVPGLPILWQAPQYILIGLSEVLSSIAQMEFFYDQAPDVMRSCSMALSLLSTAVGSYLAGALTLVVQEFSEDVTGKQWLPNDLNQGRLDLFFIFLMVVLLINLVAFVLVAIKYEYKKIKRKITVSPSVVQGKGFDTPGSHATTPKDLSTHADVATPSTGVVPVAAASTAIAIRAGTSRGAHEAEREGDEEAGSASVEVYARSLAYQPRMPTMPAPFR